MGRQHGEDADVHRRPVSVVGSLVGVAGAQQPAQRSVFERYTEPIEIYKTGLGTFTRPISSSNKEAQAFFNQGFQMMYAFAKAEAVRSFREAWKRDPDCAICYWGEAWAWGSYLNAPMTAEEAPHAYAAIQKALALKAHADAKERALIDAMAVRYVEKFDADEAGRAGPRLRGGDAEASPSAYPDDLDIATLYADALFLLEPRRGTRDVNEPERPAAAPACSSRCSRRTSIIPARAISTCTRPNRPSCRARRSVRRVPRQLDSRAPATSTTCRRTPGTRSAGGAIRCAPTSRRGIRI